jgi:hypothetical protein
MDASAAAPATMSIELLESTAVLVTTVAGVVATVAAAVVVVVVVGASDVTIDAAVDAHCCD